MLRIIVPLAIIVVVALLIGALVIVAGRYEQIQERREKDFARANWRGFCEFYNPQTGASCQREEFHLENHYHELSGGRLSQW